MVRKSCNMFVIDVCIIHSSTTDVCHLSTLRYCLIPNSHPKFHKIPRHIRLQSWLICHALPIHQSNFNFFLQVESSYPKRTPFKNKSLTNICNPKSRSTSPRWNRKNIQSIHPSERFQTGTIRGSTFLQEATPTRSGLGVLPPMVFLMIFLDLRSMKEWYICVYMSIDDIYHIHSKKEYICKFLLFLGE